MSGFQASTIQTTLFCAGVAGGFFACVYGQVGGRFHLDGHTKRAVIAGLSARDICVFCFSGDVTRNCGMAYC